MLQQQFRQAGKWGEEFCRRVETWHKGGHQAIQKDGATLLLCYKGGPAPDKDGNCPRPSWKGCKKAGYC